MAIPLVTQERRYLGDLGRRISQTAGALGLAGVLVGLVLAAAAPGGWRRFFFAYLLNFAYVLSLALGALFFVLLQHLTHAGWSVVVRRLAEAVAGTLPMMGLFLVPILFGLHELYPWSRAGALTADPILHGKAGWLSVPFFIARCALYLAVWMLIARSFVGRSLAQDATGDAGLTLRLQRRSAPAMLAFGLTFTFASFDLLMSLDPRWYSTIFGVYCFAGSVVGFLALLVLLAFGAQRAGLLRRTITVEHYHDLGKLLFAFVFFWAYIAFSQFMLLWYANIPEETAWLLRRQEHGWGVIGLVLVAGHFLLPFLLLLPRGTKRRPRRLAAVAAWALAMHWLDLYWLVMPEVSPGDALPQTVDVALLVGLVGLFAASAVLVVRSRSLLPEGDPRLEESRRFENA
jgi:hypothetical protein